MLDVEGLIDVGGLTNAVGVPLVEEITWVDLRSEV